MGPISEYLGDGPHAPALEAESKKKTFFDPKRARAPVHQQRQEYGHQLSHWDPQCLIFVDEMGATLNLTPLYGRSHKGTRAYGDKPTSRGTRISTIGALSNAALDTAMCFTGTLNGSVFAYFLEHFLCPVLQPGQSVIVDNAKAHHVDEARELIESKGARLVYLPPYSPDLNPIELVWSKVKHWLREARARTVETLYQALAEALATITSDHAAAFFKHVGIVSKK